MSENDSQKSSTDMEKDGVEESTPTQPDDSQYPGLATVIPIMAALYLGVFLVALDRTIIATAIPRITDDFHSLNDVGWYGSSYLIAACSFQLLYGKVYTLYHPKWVYVCSIVLFEVGSTICGAAPTSTAFIVGRAIAGLGSAGMFSGTVVIIVNTVPLRKRPAYTGFMGGIFGISSVVAPLLGGAFTDNVSWRWCFYINLPIGGFAMVIILLLLKLPHVKKADNKASIGRHIMRLDPLGTICFLPSMVCLLLALQWGGSTYPWSSGKVIPLLVVFAVLICAFVAIQIWGAEDATVPPRIFTQRSILSGFWYTICVAGSMLVIVYYLPIWFQAIKGASAVKSGIMNLPLILSLVLGSIMAGGLVTATGYYNPFMFLCCVLMSIGAGLITTFTPTTGHPKWIGYQIAYGLGLGLGMQQAAVASQTILSKKDVPVGVALVFFAQSLGGAVFVAVAQNIFTNKLTEGLAKIPDMDPSIILNIGATAIHKVVKDPETLTRVLAIYNDALTDAFRVALGLACASILGVIAVEWKSVKGKEKQ
ncbi:hypothetical protein D8B26_004869 [Coccidioides posadasii str. Silveira]|uniref:uncharacterized protein n=1 Tax=Coccidioides posadasii (strain RMSCC 757 / Silveira) TaxID=443226 RepID=UPI001BF08B51|nr:hypothetical protein D8B26_004869 [Coccidioides posadasii str. Silveira]